MLTNSNQAKKEVNTTGAKGFLMETKPRELFFIFSKRSPNHFNYEGETDYEHATESEMVG
jgi:hypothetical protein